MEVASHVPSRSERSPRVALAVGLAAMLVVVGVWFRLHASAGPLGPSSYVTGSTVGIPTGIGGRVAAGVFAPVNHTSEALVIDSITPDVVPQGLRVLGYEVTEGGVGSARSFPPAGFMVHRVAGWVVEPGSGVNFVVGLEPTRDGTFTIPGFTVRYHAGWHRYVVRLGQAVRVCAPMRTPACS